MSDLVNLSETERLPRWAVVIEEPNPRGIGADSRWYQLFMASDEARDHPIGGQWLCELDAVAFARAIGDAVRTAAREERQQLRRDGSAPGIVERFSCCEAPDDYVAIAGPNAGGELMVAILENGADLSVTLDEETSRALTESILFRFKTIEAGAPLEHEEPGTFVRRAPSGRLEFRLGDDWVSVSHARSLAFIKQGADLLDIMLPDQGRKR